MKPEDFVHGMDRQTLRLLHVQDTDFLDDRHQLPYLGSHDWDAFAAALGEMDYQGDLTFEIPNYFRRMPREVIPAALGLAHAVGRDLIRRVEASRPEQA